jgi:hypothetical protein
MLLEPMTAIAPSILRCLAILRDLRATKGNIEDFAAINTVVAPPTVELKFEKSRAKTHIQRPARQRTWKLLSGAGANHTPAKSGISRTSIDDTASQDHEQAPCGESHCKVTGPLQFVTLQADRTYLAKRRRLAELSPTPSSASRKKVLERPRA